MKPSSMNLIRENIEWCRIWVPDSVTVGLDIPRVLLVGDSITMGYGPEVTKMLDRKASIAWLGSSRFPTDPAFVDEILLVLKHTKFDLIHFNNGLHGFDNSDESYAKSLPKVLAIFRAASAGAKWILANSTPQWKETLETLHPQTKRIQWRNRVVKDLAAKKSLPMTDLSSVVKNHPEYYCGDGIHFKDEGNIALAKKVTAMVKKTLKIRS